MSDMTEVWPPLPYEEWKETYATLHMWTQIAGKIALAQAPPLNHCWSAALNLTSRGIATKLLPHGARYFTIEFDLVDHELVVETADGDRRAFPLEPRTVADFYHQIMSTLRDMNLEVKIWSMPVELPAPIRFEEDTIHRSYDPVYANRCWQILLNVGRVLMDARCAFIGKSSPLNFFWGAFDLALTRFSGRPAPAREGPAFMRDAYSHEVISHGFWPGGAPVLEPVFYGYAVPEPQGFKQAAVEPAAAFYHQEMGEFILPYEALRRSRSPEQALLAFITSTYTAGATLGGWDRKALERHTIRSVA
jgi:hypothetical protein